MEDRAAAQEEGPLKARAIPPDAIGREKRVRALGEPGPIPLEDVPLGRDKTATLRGVLDGPHRPDDLPAQGAAPRGGRCSLVDAAAAAEQQRR